MIYDSIQNIHLYSHLPFMNLIAQFIKDHDLNALAPGKYPIDGDTLFASVDEYQTFPASTRRFEIHHQHADLQLMISGSEYIQVGFPDDLREELPKEGEGDFYFHQIRGNAHSSLLLENGLFAFIPPFHPHRPCLQVTENTPTPIRKIVFKILMIGE